MMATETLNFASTAERELCLRLVDASATDWPRAAAEASGLLEQALVVPAQHVCDQRVIPEAQRAAFVSRVWNCLTYHAPGYLARGGRGLAPLIAAAEENGLITGCIEGSLLMDTTLAQALEEKHAAAAARFQTEFGTLLTSWARRMRGERGVAEVENFAAELIVSRPESPPRIAGYRGQTSLKAWLKAVVANFLVTRDRKRQPLTVAELPEPAIVSTLDPDRNDCVGLLTPLLSAAVGSLDAESVLLLKLTLIDHVPQTQLAAQLGIAPGNVTRRRQRAIAALLAELGRLAAAHAEPGRVSHCLELTVAGDDRELAQMLGQRLSEAIEQTPKSRTTEVTS